MNPALAQLLLSLLSNQAEIARQSQAVLALISCTSAERRDPTEAEWSQLHRDFTDAASALTNAIKFARQMGR